MSMLAKNLKFKMSINLFLVFFRFSQTEVSHIIDSFLRIPQFTLIKSFTLNESDKNCVSELENLNNIGQLNYLFHRFPHFLNQSQPSNIYHVLILTPLSDHIKLIFKEKWFLNNLWLFHIYAIENVESFEPSSLIGLCCWKHHGMALVDFTNVLYSIEKSTQLTDVVSHFQLTLTHPDQFFHNRLICVNYELNPLEFFCNLSKLFVGDSKHWNGQPHRLALLIVVNFGHDHNHPLMQKAKLFFQQETIDFEITEQVAKSFADCFPELVNSWFVAQHLQYLQVVKYNPLTQVSNYSCRGCYYYHMRIPFLIKDLGLSSGIPMMCFHCLGKPKPKIEMCPKCSRIYHFTQNKPHDCHSNPVWTCKTCQYSFDTPRLDDSMCDFCRTAGLVIRTLKGKLLYPVSSPLMLFPKDYAIQSCDICFEHKAETRLCMNKKCFAKSCFKCRIAWYTQPGDGREFFVSKTLCPFCKESTSRDYSHLNPDCRYAKCFQCHSICPLEIDCTGESAPIDGWVCERCLQKYPQNGRICPGCQVWIFKLSGCNHMKCTNCLTHFCYRCGENITGKSVLHYQQCYLFRET